MTDPQPEVRLVFGCCDPDERARHRKSANEVHFFDFCDCHSDGCRCHAVQDVGRVLSTYNDSLRAKQRKNITKLAGTERIRGECCECGHELREQAWREVEKSLVDLSMRVSNHVLDGWMCIENMIANAPLMLTRPTLCQLRYRYRSPAVAVASGPSVGDHVERLREIQDSVIICCAESALRGLVENGVYPQFICPQERVESPFLPGMREWCPDDYLPFIVATPMVHQTSIAAFEGRVVPVVSWNQPWRWYWAFHGTKHATLEGSSTGVAAVTYANLLTSGPVFLVGHDLAYDDKDSHWDGAKQTAELWGDSVGDNASRVCGYDDIELDANGGGTVRSSLLWARFRNEIADRAAEMRRKGRTIINTNHSRGAKVGYTLTMDLPTDLPDLMLGNPLPRMPKPSAFREWVHNLKSLAESAKSPPYKDKNGNQTAIDMILGCIDTCLGYWRHHAQRHGYDVDLDKIRADAREDTMKSMYPKLQRMLEWIQPWPERYETFLKSQTP